MMLYFWFFILFSLIEASRIHAFSCSRYFHKPHPGISLSSTSNELAHFALMKKTKLQSRSALFYRAHDSGDSEESISRLRTRASPTFQKSEIDQSTAKRLRGINGLLIVSLIINQLVILTLAGGLTALYLLFSGDAQFINEGILNWNYDIVATTNNFGSLDLSVTPTRLLQGFLGAVPTIALSQRIERSEDRQYALTNFSTIFMVMTLFGRRSSTRSTETETERKLNDVDKINSKRKISVMDKLDPITNTIGKKYYQFSNPESTPY